MKNAKDVVLTGVSAGGMAAIYWADYLGTLIDKTKTNYVVAPDSGFTHLIKNANEFLAIFVDVKYIINHLTNKINI